MSEQLTATEKVEQQTEAHPRHTLSLIGLLVIAVLLSLVLVAVAYLMYLRSPNSKYDIARPGSPSDTTIVDIESNDSDTSSAVDAQAAKQKIDSLDKEIKALAGYRSFGPDDVSDQSLGLQPSDQPSR